MITCHKQSTENGAKFKSFDRAIVDQYELVDGELDEYVRQCFAESQPTDTCFDWLLAVWSHLVPNEEVEKDYEYRTKAGHIARRKEEDAPPQPPPQPDANGEIPDDSDEREMRAWLPDYSEENGLRLNEDGLIIEEMVDDDEDEGRQGGRRQRQPRVTPKHLHDVLRLIINKDETKCSDLYQLRMLTIEQSCAAVANVEQVDQRLLGAHLVHLSNSVRQMAKLNDDGVDNHRHIDVYNEPPRMAQINRCNTLLNALDAAVVELLADWPEVTSLTRIRTCIRFVLDQPLDAPWMKLAAQLERLLEECEHWELVASKTVSLSSWLNPIRQLLVDWRRAQVKCWAHLLSCVDADISQQTLLAVLPVVASIYHKLKPCPTDVTTVCTILAMCQTWLTTSTIGDLRSRLDGIALAVRFVQILIPSTKDSSLISQLRSLSAYFGQFSAAVEDRVKQVTAPIRKELEDLIKIVKFQDLNTWSVKLSAQKAHAQLFRIIKKYKDALSAPCADIYERPLPDVTLLPVATCNDIWAFSNHCRADELAEQILQRITSNTCCQVLGDFAEMADEVNTLIAKPVIYTGDDDHKAKLHGRAISGRQRALTDALKTARKLGWAFRKGLRLDIDKLTGRLMMEFEQSSANLVHHVASSRLLVHRSIASLSSAQNKPAAIGPQLIQTGQGLVDLMAHSLADLVDKTASFNNGVGHMESIATCFTKMALDTTTTDLSSSSNVRCRQLTEALTARIGSCRSNISKQLDLWSCAACWLSFSSFHYCPCEPIAMKCIVFV